MPHSCVCVCVSVCVSFVPRDGDPICINVLGYKEAERAKNDKEGPKAAKAERTLLFTYPHWLAKEGTDTLTDALDSFHSRVRKERTDTRHRYTLRMHSHSLTSQLHTGMRAATHTYTLIRGRCVYTFSSFGCVEETRQPLRTCERTKARDGRPTNLVTLRYHCAVNKNAPIIESYFTFTISYHKNVFRESRYFNYISRIAPRQLGRLAFTEPTSAPSNVHNAAITITTTTTTTTILPTVLPL